MGFLMSGMKELYSCGNEHCDQSLTRKKINELVEFVNNLEKRLAELEAERNNE